MSDRMGKPELLDLEPTLVSLDNLKGGFVVDPEELDIEAEFSRTANVGDRFGSLTLRVFVPGVE